MDILAILKFLNPFALISKGRKYYRRPKLIVYFDPNETYHRRVVTDQNNTPGFFCHVMVKNEGKDIARNCRGRIINIQMEDNSGNFVKHSMFLAPMILKWAHEGDFDPRDIVADLPRRLDLCVGLQNQPNNLFFFTINKPDGNQTVYPPGKYRITIRLDSDNASTVDQHFIIDFKGGWDQISIEQA